MLKNYFRNFNLLMILLLLMNVAIFFACTNEKTQFSISGNIKNTKNGYLLFVRDTIGYGISYTVDTIKIDESGKFEVKVKPIHYTAMLVFEDKNPLRIEIPNCVNKPIKITLDFSTPDNIKIEGEQAAFIQYKLDQMKYWAKIYNSMSAKYQDIAKDNKTALYAAVQDTMTQLRIQYLINYFKNINLKGTKQFVSDEENSFKYASLYYRMSGENPDIIKRLAFYQKAKGTNPHNFLTYSNEVDLSNKDLFSLPYFQQFAHDFISNSVRLIIPDTVSRLNPYYLNQHLTQGFKVIDEWFKSSNLNAIQKTLYVNELIEISNIFKNPIDINEFQKTLEDLKQIKFASNYIPPIEKKLQQLNNSMSKFSPGKKVPEFTVSDRHGKSYTLSQFEGKLICIDVWASWCRPCVASLPEWKKLVSENSRNKNTVFLSISLDEDFDKWINAVDKFNPSGITLHAGSAGFKSQFAKAFDLTAIPTSILIDQEGNFISFPSSYADAQAKINEYTPKNEKN